MFKKLQSFKKKVRIKWCKIIFVQKMSPLINKLFNFRLLIIWVNDR